jgi:hypothetical protein
VGGGKTVMLFFDKKNSLVKKRKCEMVRYHDATASSFVTKVRGKVLAHFHAVTVKHHSSMQY